MMTSRSDMTPNQFLDSLPPREKQAVQYYLGGLLSKQAAQKMGIDSRTVTTMWSRARSKARKYGLDFRPQLVITKFEEQL